MREVIVICQSQKKSRVKVAKVLDRYFWRIGARTWRGKATNACLDRVSRELRAQATRNTAVTIHEIRSAHESRIPLVRIGSKSAFSDEGLVSVSSQPAKLTKIANGSPSDITAAAIVRIAALFHDLGKATVLFQGKLLRALEAGDPESDAIRHELHSAVVWDILFGVMSDEDLCEGLKALSSDLIDDACRCAISVLCNMHRDPTGLMRLSFLSNEGSQSQAIGQLILTHHRLPDGDTDDVGALVTRHVNQTSSLRPDDLKIAKGTPFWHEAWWEVSLKDEAARLTPSAPISSLDIALRASIMFADHLGSAAKVPSSIIPDHLANTVNASTGSKHKVAADSLSKHVKRVYKLARGSFDLLHRYRDRFSAISESQVPIDVMHPTPSGDQRFDWQSEAAQTAKSLCASNEGGFFACLMAGTGTGKTRGAPTILAAAAMSDARPERRYLRMNLALGLRVLATQSAREYVDDLGFRDDDVAVLIGEAPLNFDDIHQKNMDGSESLIALPEWLQVETVKGAIPLEGSDGEVNWLRSLSHDSDRGLPAFCEMILDAAGKRAPVGRRLITPPIMVGTIDHLMGVASPVNSRFLIQSIRVITSDLILDEIDQFDGEDIAAIGRLIFQTGAAGRRVIIMSATLTPDIAEALHIAYQKGWESFASSRGISKHVNLLCAGDAQGSCFTNEGGRNISDVLSLCRTEILKGISSSPALRRGEILPVMDGWEYLVQQVDDGCHRMHDINAENMSGFRVSVGLVKMTRISHTTAMACQLPSGDVSGRFRIVICLHSAFPRLHRSWIEARLKRALTRKDVDPDQGVKDFCISEDIFDRAEELKFRDIEIVVVASPVIETGNDLDFDYAILDPISMRSIIQASGRVRRHRPAKGSLPNILIFGRSPIAMQGGILSQPGVETRPAPETRVERVSLNDFEGRHFTDLCGDETFSTISAASLISGDGLVPLRDAEAILRGRMINPAPSSPFGKYVTQMRSRFTLAPTRKRKFRRSDTRSIDYVMIGDNLREAQWHVDLAPGTRDSALQLAAHIDLSVIAGSHAFSDVTEAAWFDYGKSGTEMSPYDIKNMMRVTIPDYSRDIASPMTYTEFTGFTRGSSEDLFRAFGKSN